MLEILIGASVITASFLGVLTVFDRLIKASQQMMNSVQVNFLLEEGLEAVRIWRDNGWSNLGDWPAGTEYYLTWTDSRWATSTNNVFLDGKFERKIKLLAVSRDDDTDDIVAVGGTDDPGTKFVTMTVAWRADKATTTKAISTYFTNLFN